MSKGTERKQWTAPAADEHTGKGGVFHKVKGGRQLVERTGLEDEKAATAEAVQKAKRAPRKSAAEPAAAPAPAEPPAAAPQSDADQAAA